jgi:ubiquitin carboxyl-terminal hydrolase 31
MEAFTLFVEQVVTADMQWPKSHTVLHHVYAFFAGCDDVSSLSHRHLPHFIVFTAYCHNPYDTQWYCFDDTRVEPVADTSLVTAAAYILFYQRRGLGTSYSSAASTSSSGSGGLEHWVCRMPAFTRSSKSQEELSHKGQFVVMMMKLGFVLIFMFIKF